ncbi:MAG: hypothetical protein HGB36_11860 [Chlorobiaceae bacterium]|nr:hypothetical protein [Chlorobiaceae bacterium]
MKKGFEIVEYDSGEGGTLYSIRFEGESINELDKFLLNKDLKRRADFRKVSARLLQMVDYEGFKLESFEHDGSKMDSVVKLKYGGIRLFCLRWGNTLLIAGGGGIKSTQKTQQNPVHDEIVKNLQMIEKLLEKRKKTKEIDICYDDGKISGNLNFTTGDTL